MSSALVSLSSRHARVAMAAVLCVLAPAVAAQERQNGAAPVEAAAAEDPRIIIARTVNPRIAYRGVPTEDNPVHTEATLFPARAFHAALDGTVGELVGDEALGARGSAGLHTGAAVESSIDHMFLGGTGPLGPSMGAGATATGPGAAVGGAVGTFGGTVGRAVSAGTAGIGGVLGAMPALMPAQQGGGP